MGVGGSIRAVRFDKLGRVVGVRGDFVDLRTGAAIKPTIPAPPSSGAPPPLDTGTNNGMALSVRRIRDDYAGPCCEVVRASDSAVTDIGFNAQGWRDDVALAAFAAGSDVYLSRWYNQDVTGQDAVQTTAAIRPLAAIAGVPVVEPENGNPAFFGEGTTRGTYMLSENNIGDDDSKTIAIVAYTINPNDPGDNSENNWICGQASGIQTHQVEWNERVGNDRCQVTFNNAPVSDVVNDVLDIQDNLHSFTYSSNGIVGLTPDGPWDQVYLDGQKLPNGGNGGNWFTNRQMRVFGGQFVNNTLLDGYLCEFIVWNGDYSTGTLALDTTAVQVAAFGITP